MELPVALAGFGVGLVVGFSGMGGAALLTPILILFFGVPPRLAVGTDLAFQAVTKAVGAAQHYRQGTVNPSLVWWLAVGSLPAAVVGIGLTRLLQIHNYSLADSVISRSLAVALMLAAGAIILRRWYRQRRPAQLQMPYPHTRRKQVLTVLLGAGVGFTVSLTSVGSGTLLMPLLLLLYPLSAAQAVGVDIFHAALLVAVAGTGHLLVGNVDLLLVANLLVGSLPGILIGSRLTLRIPERVLRPGLALLLLVASLHMW